MQHHISNRQHIRVSENSSLRKGIWEGFVKTVRVRKVLCVYSCVSLIGNISLKI